jgi:hypothetical protein
MPGLWTVRDSYVLLRNEILTALRQVVPSLSGASNSNSCTAAYCVPLLRPHLGGRENP